MFSYRQSEVVIIFWLVLVLLWMIGGVLPRGDTLKTSRLFSGFLYPFRKLNQRMIERKGLVWTGLIWWSVVTFVMVAIVLNSQNGVLARMKMIIGAAVPPALCWWLRNRIRKRRQRRYTLPGRRR